MGRFVTELAAVLEQLEQLEIDAEDCDMLAVVHKIREARGPLQGAKNAAAQYDNGLLPYSGPITALDLTCRACKAAPKSECSPLDWEASLVGGHLVRDLDALEATMRRDNQLAEDAEAAGQ